MSGRETTKHEVFIARRGRGGEREIDRNEDETQQSIEKKGCVPRRHRESGRSKGDCTEGASDKGTHRSSHIPGEVV
jgi:hypothetical protein